MKARSVSSADLLDTNGGVVRSASLSAGSVVFDLHGLAIGDYFIRVNGDAADLVPTRIDNPDQTVSQRVGATLARPRALHIESTSVSSGMSTSPR